MKNLHCAILAGCSLLALAGCGADDVVAPNGNIIVNPTPSPSPSPSPTPGGSVTAAAGCTTGTVDLGTIVLKDSRGTIRSCGIPASVAGTLNLTARRADGVMYALQGRTDVGTDVRQAGTAATINISAGVTVFGLTEASALVINRGSKINALGTSAQPIIFTSLSNLRNDPVAGALTETTTKQWGGIVINGQAKVSDCETGAGSTSALGGNTNCWKASEGFGAPRPIYGGDIDNDNSGTLSFVQINFAGFPLQQGDEINSLTLNAVGSGTTLSNIQIHNGADDGIELFGGAANAKRLVLTGNADDSLDVDNGFRGSFQYVLAVRHASDGFDGDTGTAGETIMEIDTGSSQPVDYDPRVFVKVANFTYVQNKSGETVIRARGGADLSLANGIIVSRPSGAQGCFDVDDAQTTASTAGTAVGPAPGAPAGTEQGPPVLRSVVFDCDVVDDPDDALEAAALGNAQNSNVNQSFVSSLLFLNGSTVGRVANGTNESGVTSVANIKTLPFGDPFFDQVNYIGAFSGPSDLWTQDWTCNSKLVNLRGATNCTDIRIS